MVSWKISTLLLLSLRALNALAQAEIVEEVTEEAPQSPNLKVSIETKFPQSEIFGVKIINGHATQAVVSISNDEPTPVGLSIIGGSLIQDGLAGAESHIVRNLTAARYSTEIPAGASETITYTFSTEVHPQDLRLQLVAVLKDSKDAFYTLSAYNETITVVEAPTSIFDPQMYVPSRTPAPNVLDGCTESLLYTAISHSSC
ncbi:hypothetical protein BCR34DRAFT_527993 [Clohesyomyces aquaticus]|uniref:Uncharacterized protein n=1 Tax=Clohesyomyces aquaticus TaxID=1231657 RepID=A0A1Y2ABF7_9PLEO|nr:hypothetical protein BCR34DRAFT_527993 [Clohesyomyces aquaticus]